MIEAIIFAFETGTVGVQTVDAVRQEVEVRYDPQTGFPAPAIELGKRYKCQGGQPVEIRSGESGKQGEIVLLQGVVPVTKKAGGGTIDIDFGNPEEGCGTETLVTKASPGGRLKCCGKPMSREVPKPLPGSD